MANKMWVLEIGNLTDSRHQTAISSTDYLPGKFLFRKNKKEAIIEKPFHIDIYPETNAQYEQFISQKGYENRSFWSKEGFNWVKKNNITKPAYWEDERFNESDHPVVGVSFYEVEAYARWAGIRLPMDLEWERAARGTDGRESPWGDEFDKDRCNSQEFGIGHTTSVTRYPDGRSPDGAMKWPETFGSGARIGLLKAKPPCFAWGLLGQQPGQPALREPGRVLPEQPQQPRRFSVCPGSFLTPFDLTQGRLFPLSLLPYTAERSEACPRVKLWV